MRVCLGGTFNVFHRGHRALIDKAIEIAGKNGYIFIGITIGDLIKFKTNVKSFHDRKIIIEKYVDKYGNNKIIEIEPIENKFGPIIEKDFDVIIISPESRKNAEEINHQRKIIGKHPLELIQIPLVLADDNKPISTSRILKNEIDKDGRLLYKD